MVSSTSLLSTLAPAGISLSAGWRRIRRTRPGTLSMSDCKVLEISARTDASCLPHAESLRRSSSVRKPRTPSWRVLSCSATFWKWPRLMSDRRLAARQDRSCSAMVTATPYGEADDLPRRGQPLHHQRQRERQQLRRLQGRYAERNAD